MKEEPLWDTHDQIQLVSAQPLFTISWKKDGGGIGGQWEKLDKKQCIPVYGVYLSTVHVHCPVDLASGQTEIHVDTRIRLGGLDCR